eukprot:3932886-Rhodomonas_salina.6
MRSTELGYAPTLSAMRCAVLSWRIVLRAVVCAYAVCYDTRGTELLYAPALSAKTHALSAMAHALSAMTHAVLSYCLLLRYLL